MKLTYGYIFTFPNKLKFDDYSLSAKLLIMEQKMVNDCPSDTLISFKSNFWML